MLLSLNDFIILFIIAMLDLLVLLKLEIRLRVAEVIFDTFIVRSKNIDHLAIIL